jgi:hypothetical protein
MPEWLRSRTVSLLARIRPKRKSGDLAKYLYLTDKQLIYRHITDVHNAPIETRLDVFYSQLSALRPERNSAYFQYAVAFGASLLTEFNLIANVSAGGVSVLPIALKHVVLVAFAVTQLRLGFVLSKYSYIVGIFEHRFYASPPYRRADMLARYPFAFDTMKYFVTQIGTLPHTASMRLPKRMIGMLILLVIGLLVYVSFSIWLFMSLAHAVWTSVTPLPTFWSKSVVFVSLAMAAATYLLPTDLLFKRSYMHIGLIKMMNRAHEEDRPRYLRYFEWTRGLR